MAKDAKEIVAIAFDKAELWELICNFGASFEKGGEGNELAEAVSRKLHAAYDRKFRRPPRGR